MSTSNLTSSLHFQSVQIVFSFFQRASLCTAADYSEASMQVVLYFAQGWWNTLFILTAHLLQHWICWSNWRLTLTWQRLPGFCSLLFFVMNIHISSFKFVEKIQRFSFIFFGFCSHISCGKRFPLFAFFFQALVFLGSQHHLAAKNLENKVLSPKGFSPPPQVNVLLFISVHPKLHTHSAVMSFQHMHASEWQQRWTRPSDDIYMQIKSANTKFYSS